MAPSKTHFDVKLTQSQKEKLIRDLLGRDYNLKGKYFPILSNLIDIISYGDAAFTVGELIPKAALLIGENATLTATASGLSIASIVLFPVGSMISIINAMQTDQKMYGMRAISYTTTAWAFNDAIPPSSPTILNNMRNGKIRAKEYKFTEHAKAWAEASNATIRQLQQEISRMRTEKIILQLLLRASGNNERTKLCAALLKGFETDLDTIDKIFWTANYKIQYPH